MLSLSYLLLGSMILGFGEEIFVFGIPILWRHSIVNPSFFAHWTFLPLVSLSLEEVALVSWLILIIFFVGRQRKIWISFFGDVSLRDLFGTTSFRCSNFLFVCQRDI